MGEYKEPNGTRSFEPDDTYTEFFVMAHYMGANLGNILKKARTKWGDDIDINDLEIEAVHIHTHCLGYDCYDPGDHTNYLRIEYNPA